MIRRFLLLLLLGGHFTAWERGESGAYPVSTGFNGSLYFVGLKWNF